MIKLKELEPEDIEQLRRHVRPESRRELNYIPEDSDFAWAGVDDGSGLVMAIGGWIEKDSALFLWSATSRYASLMPRAVNLAYCAIMRGALNISSQVFAYNWISNKRACRHLRFLGFTLVGHIGEEIEILRLTAEGLWRSGHCYS
jgi:hypothetical protein